MTGDDRTRALERRLDHQTILNSVTLALSSSMDTPELLTLMARSALRLADAGSSSIFVDDGLGLRRASRACIDEGGDFASTRDDDDDDDDETTVARAVYRDNAQKYGDAQGLISTDYGGTEALPIVVLGVPVRYKHRIMGAMCVASPSGGGFTASDMALLTVLCSHAALALETARLVDEERRRAHQALTLLAAANSSGATLALDDVLNEIVTTTARLTGADRSSILLLDGQSRLLHPAALFNMDQNFVQRWRRQELPLEGEPLSFEAITSAQPVVVRDAEHDPRTNKGAVHLFGDKSMLVVPMFSKGEAIGTLWVNHVRHHYDFTDDDIRITMAIANQAALSIVNARLYHESQRQREQLATRRLTEVATVLGVSTEIASILDLDVMLDSVVRNVRKVMGANSCRLYRIVEAGREIMLVAESHTKDGLSPDAMAALRPHVLRSMSAREPMLLHPVPGRDASQDQAALCVPLIARDRVLGSLCIHVAGEHAFPPDEQQLLMAFANHAAVAIDTANLVERLERRVQELSGLHELSTTMVALPALGQTIGHVSAKLGELLDVQHCAILMYDGNSDEVVAQAPAHGLTDQQVNRLRFRLEEGMATTHVWKTGHPYLSNAVSIDEGHSRQWVHEFQEETLLLVPMRAGATTIGVIRAANKRHGGFTHDDVRLLSIFATQAASIVSNAVLYDRVNRERAHLDAILERTSDSIFVFRLNGTLLRMNRAAETLFGGEPETTDCSDCTRLFRCRDVGTSVLCAQACMIQQVARQRNALPYLEHRVVGRDGRELDVTSSYTYIEQQGAEEPCVVVITRDISKLKEVERLKTDFVSMVSHELRTPLALIKGFASTLLRLRDSLDRSTELKFLQNIDDASDRLTRLIDNILNVSRIESGSFKTNLQRVRVTELVQRTVSSFRFQTHDHRVECDLPEPSPVIFADRDQIEQVLLNLLTNAVKYSAKHGTIAIRVREQDAGVEINVHDEGPGIGAGQLTHLFDKFYRGDSAATHRAPGTGLGLYICKTIIEAHGGNIEVESNQDQGSTFRVLLPHSAVAHDGDPPGSH